MQNQFAIHINSTQLLNWVLAAFEEISKFVRKIDSTVKNG